MNFTPLDNTGRVEGFCLVKSVEKKTSSKGDTYLDFTLSDKDGEVNAKLWRYDPYEHGEYKPNDVVKVRGSLLQYNGSDQLRIDRIRTALPEDNINMEELVKTASYSSEDMYGEIIGIANAFKDDGLKRLVTAIYEDNRVALLYWPAAFKLHHAMRGGLLMHTLSIVRLAQSVCAIYPFIDRELLIAGAMLHDISKLDEFIVGESGVAEGYSVEGNLIGHLVMGANKVDKYAEKLGIDRKTAILVEHMLLSHHGEPDFGAAVRPMFLEAEILSELDLMDARLYEIKESLMSAKDEDFTSKIWALDNRKFYNHARTDVKADPKLF